jgi:hypothetical protein
MEYGSVFMGTAQQGQYTINPIEEGHKETGRLAILREDPTLHIYFIIKKLLCQHL